MNNLGMKTGKRKEGYITWDEEGGLEVLEGVPSSPVPINQS